MAHNFARAKVICKQLGNNRLNFKVLLDVVNKGVLFVLVSYKLNLKQAFVVHLFSQKQNYATDVK